MDLRCPSKKHAVLDGEFIEVKCGSRFCGAGPGIVVLHLFDKNAGELVKTSRFRDPAFNSIGKDSSASSAERVSPVRD